MPTNSGKWRVLQNPMQSTLYSRAANWVTVVLGVLFSAAMTAVFALAFLTEFSDSPPLAICGVLLGALPLWLWTGSVLYQTVMIERIRRQGERVDGEIISFYQTGSYRNRRTWARVVFRYGARYTYSVSLGIRPWKHLASARCSVYILDDKLYIGDFQRKKRGEPGDSLPSIP